jgi:hypothetical protein
MRILRMLGALAALTGILTGATATAQERQSQPPAPVRVEAPAVIVDDQNARETRQRLHEVLNQYPPSVAQVLRLDPSLLTRTDYLAPYPKLAAFLSQHPEVAHNPGFFLGELRFDPAETDKARAMNLLHDVLGGVAALIVFGTMVSLVAWGIRSLIDYVQWRHVTKIQTDAHTKLVDRLTANDDLLAYMQSPAGQRYLSWSPASFELAPRAVGAPVSRILWSVQAGVVLAVGGIGLWIAKSSVIEEVAQGLQVIAVLAVALGVGFVLSGIVAYILSARLKLFDPQPRSSHA